MGHLNPKDNQTRKKIPRKYSGIMMGSLLVLPMAFMMSFVITFLNIGLVANFLTRWLTAYFSILPIAIPIALFLTPLVKTFVDRIAD